MSYHATIPGVAMSEKLLHQRALEFVLSELGHAGLRAEAAPPDLPGDAAIVGRDGRSLLVRILVRAGPHHRGGRGSLGLHWMLRDTPAEFVALVDLSRRLGWLLPTAHFRAQASALSDGRFHLDWIVVPLTGRTSRVPQEGEFERYAFESALPELTRDFA
jgi:hypothetical protein